MPFNDTLWDDTDPSYAPCLARIRKRMKWVAPKKYRVAGYAISTEDLGPAEGRDPTIEQARRCRELTREMVRWSEQGDAGRQPDTWGWLMGRYMHDEYSSFNMVRPITRAQYRSEVKKIEAAISEVLLAETDYTRMMTWRMQMQKNGRSNHYIKKFFTHLGLVLSHGVKIEHPEAKRIKTIQSEMRIPSGPKRHVYAKPEQVEAIIGYLDAQGLQWASLAVLFRFEFALRGTDVYGQWEPVDKASGGIVYRNSHGAQAAWVDGITWDMIDPTVSTLTKVISKTRTSNPEPLCFPIDRVPDLRRRLLAIPMDERIGPVIKTKRGIPPLHDRITKAFKRAVRALKLPDDLQLRDTRAGGITEGAAMGNPFAIQQAAQHSDLRTTNRYIRSENAGVLAMVDFRQAGRKK